MRLSVSNYEALAANALRRGLRAGERVGRAPRRRPRRAGRQLDGGKIEIESLEEGREGAIFENLVKGAVLTVFKERVPPEQIRDVVAAFEEGVVAHTGEDVALGRRWPRWSSRCRRCARRSPRSPAATSHRRRVAAAVEFVLEGLHLSKRLNKDESGTGDLPRPQLSAASRDVRGSTRRELAHSGCVRRQRPPRRQTNGVRVQSSPVSLRSAARGVPVSSTTSIGPGSRAARPRRTAWR